MSEPTWLDKLKSRLGFEGEPASLRQTIEMALQTKSGRDTSFKPQERTMLLNILRFGALRVVDVMVPRADIIAIDESQTLGDLLQRFQDAGHSRLPVYRETLDDPVGMIHIRDFVQWIANTSDHARKTPLSECSNLEGSNNIVELPDFKSQIDLSGVDLSLPISSAKLHRDMLFVPGSMSVVDLFLRMQTKRVHLALVIDEYGGTYGLVSIEDLVEEIVGEIEDEHDEDDSPMVREDPQHGLVADARTPIDELEKRLNMSLTLSGDGADHADTIGGLLFSIVKHVPVRGELIAHPVGIEFEVIDADTRRIKMLKIHLKPKVKKKNAKPQIVKDVIEASPEKQNKSEVA